MANLNRLKTPQKSNNYRNEYEFSNTITKITFWSIRSYFGQLVPIKIKYELTKISTN